MKKLLAISLVITLMFTTVFSAFAVGDDVNVNLGNQAPTTNVVLSDFNDADGTNWYCSNSSRISYKDDNGDGVNDYAQIITNADGKTASLCSTPFVINPGEDYEITFYARVPSDSDSYITDSNEIYPKFAIYQPVLDANGIKVTDIHQEGENEYAYGSAKYGTVRRSEFSMDWKIGDYDSITINGHSLVKTQFYDICKDADGNKISANDALKDWTKITCTFKGLDDAENVGPQTVALNFSLKTGVPNLKLDIKDVKVIENPNAAPEEPENPELPDSIIYYEDFEQQTDETIGNVITNRTWAKPFVSTTEVASGSKSLSIYAMYEYLFVPIDKTTIEQGQSMSFLWIGRCYSIPIPKNANLINSIL